MRYGPTRLEKSQTELEIMFDLVKLNGPWSTDRGSLFMPESVCYKPVGKRLE